MFHLLITTIAIGYQNGLSQTVLTLVRDTECRFAKRYSMHRVVWPLQPEIVKSAAKAKTIKFEHQRNYSKPTVLDPDVLGSIVTMPANLPALNSSFR